jgi:1-acyl-sn-glycerol-3-phosphate acyltransferase
MGIVSRSVGALLDLVVAKPIAIFVWWLSNRANRIDFQDRVALRRRVGEAARTGRPVLFASNHVSMFDDPVLPMELYQTGQRALVELLVLVALLLAGWTVPATVAPPALLRGTALAWTVVIAIFGARKVWWSLGDLVNFSGAAALRGKLELGHERPLSRLGLALLSIADRTIYGFMRSGTVKTVFVDRRPGEEAKRARGRAVVEATELAARGEPLWIFFEGGRAKQPGEIGPARRGIGDIVLALRERGLDPLVIAIHHRGLERVIPRGSKRWLTSGHRIEACWSECHHLGGSAGSGSDAQSIADAVRSRVASLELGKPTRSVRDA